MMRLFVFPTDPSGSKMQVIPKKHLSSGGVISSHRNKWQKGATTVCTSTWNWSIDGLFLIFSEDYKTGTLEHWLFRMILLTWRNAKHCSSKKMQPDLSWNDDFHQFNYWSEFLLHFCKFEIDWWHELMIDYLIQEILEKKQTLCIFWWYGWYSELKIWCGPSPLPFSPLFFCMTGDGWHPLFQICATWGLDPSS